MELARRLFHYWFEDERGVPSFCAPLRYEFCPSEAFETLAWLVEIAGHRAGFAPMDLGPGWEGFRAAEAQEA